MGASKLSGEAINALEPLLGSFARLIADNDDISDTDIEILLISADIEPKAEVIAELLRWTELLQRAKAAKEERTGQTVREALMQRGIQQASAQLAVSLVGGQEASTASTGFSPGQVDLVVSPDHLDFGTLSSNQGATKMIDVQGGEGTIFSDSDRIVAKPERFNAGETRIAVTVHPKSGASVLWATLTIASSSRTVYVPVVAQWEESAASVGTVPPPPNSTIIPPDGIKSVTITTSEENLAPPRTSGQTGTASSLKSNNPPSSTTSLNKPTYKRAGRTRTARPWTPIVITCIVGILAVVGFLIIIDLNGDRTNVQEQAAFSTPTQDVSSQSPTPIEKLAIEPTSTELPTITPLPTNTSVVPTFTPSPTNTPVVPTFTPTPDLRHFVLNGPAEQWLPDDLEWLSGMQVVLDEEVSSDAVAQNTSDPDETLARFEEFGRVGSHVRAFQAADFCNLNSGITYVWMQVIIFRQSQGVTSFLEYLNEDLSEKLGHIGEDAWLAGWYNYESGCTPPQQMRSVEINLRRFNIYFRIVVEGIADTVNDKDLVELAKGLASSIDNNLLEEAP